MEILKGKKITGFLRDKSFKSDLQCSQLVEISTSTN